MPLAARETDSVATGHGCDGSTTLAVPGQTTVFIEALLAARLGDLTVSHTQPAGDACVPHTAPIAGSSGTVYIVGAKAARKTDSCDAGSITGSAVDVYIGD